MDRESSMGRYILLVLALMVLTMTVTAFGQETQVDRYTIDDFEKISGWSTINGGKIGSSDVVVKQGEKSLKWTAQIIKPRNSLTGIEKRKLGLPVPNLVSIRIYPERPHVIIGLSDSQGNRVIQSPVRDLFPRQWNTVKLSPKAMQPVGRDAKPLTDLDSIFIGTEDGAGENPATGEYIFYIDDLAAIYPAGTAPNHEQVPSEALFKEKLEIARVRLGKLDELMVKAETSSIDVSYPRVSRTVVGQFIDFAAAEAQEGKLSRAHKQADFIIECANRAIDELQTMLDDPTKRITMPKVAMQNITAKDGDFYSGNRPVEMVGLCGWWDKSYFPTVKGTGFNAISMEIGPSGSLKPDETLNEASIAKVTSILDTAKEHNMAVDLLLSPHYFPDWAYAKHPTADADSARRNRGGFMPWDVSDQGFREVVEKHLGAVIPRVRDHPSLLSYDLVNEAWYELMGDFYLGDYDKWMSESPGGDDSWVSLYDFNRDRVTDFFRWYTAAVHKHDVRHPTWAKIIGLGEVMGVDREAIGDILDANGMDCWPRYPDPTGRYALDVWTQAIMHDTYRSFQPDKPVLDGEYHIISYGSVVPEGYVRTCLWNAHLHGRDFSAIWVWGRDLENDLNSFYTQPSAVEEAGRTALDLQRLAEYVVEFPRQKSEVALFYGGADFQRAYEAMYFLDAQFDLVSERRIEAGKLSAYKLLVIPANVKLSRPIEKAVESFRRSGGVVFTCRDIPGQDEKYLSREIETQYGRAKINRPVRADKWGVECRSAMMPGGRCAYLINYTKKPVKVRLSVSPKVTTARDLITGRETGLGFSLDPMTPMLLELR